MKKCPYCAEEIQLDAIKCKHCGEFLNKKPKSKWYFKPIGIVIAFCCVGPLALPVVWLNPQLSRAKKIVITIIFVIVTFLIGVYLAKALKILTAHYQQIFELM